MTESLVSPVTTNEDATRASRNTRFNALGLTLATGRSGIS